MGLGISPLQHMAYIDPAWRSVHHKLSGMATIHICFLVLLWGGRWRSAPVQQPVTDASSTFCRHSQQMGIWQPLSSLAGSISRSSSQGHRDFVSIWLPFPIPFHAVCRSGIRILILPACLLGDLTGLQQSSIMAPTEMGSIGMMTPSVIMLLVWQTCWMSGHCTVFIIISWVHH
jgi:hypothetical protein